LTELTGVLIAIVSSCLGGTAAAVTRYLVGNADPITLAILRWGIGFILFALGGAVVAGKMAAAQRLACGRGARALLLRTIFRAL